MKQQKTRKMGAPTKVEGGFTKVLYVRTNQHLLDALDAVVKKERRARRDLAISRSDIARDLLYKALFKESPTHV